MNSISLLRNKAALLGKRIRLLTPIVFTSLSLLMSPFHSEATIVIPPSFEILVNQADTIIDAEVTGVRVGYEGPKKKIYTYVTLKVLETVKGNPAQPYVLRIAGGTLDGIAMEVDGSPTFSAGDRALFFIYGNGKYSVPLIGVSYGTYWIEKDIASGEDSVLKPDGTPLISTTQIDDEHAAGPSIAKTSSRKAAKSAHGALKLEDFKQAIRAHAK